MDGSPQDQLQEAARLLRAGHKPEALRMVKHVLLDDRRNLQAWWLAAHAAPDDDETRAALNVVLKLKPDHLQARTMLDRLTQPPPTEADFTADTPAPIIPRKVKRERKGCLRRNLSTLLIVGVSMLIMSGGLLYFILNLTGSSAVQVIDTELGGGPRPTATPGRITHDQEVTTTIQDGETQEFRFSGRSGTQLFVGVGFATVRQDANSDGALELIDPNGYRVATSGADLEGLEMPNLPLLDMGNISILQFALDKNGIWVLRVHGRAGLSSGAYVLMMQCFPENNCSYPPGTRPGG
jgi:hypothetical protein